MISVENKNTNKLKHLFIGWSTGLDSTTLLYHALEDGFEIHPLCFVYNERSYLEYLNALNFWSSELQDKNVHKPILIDVRDNYPTSNKFAEQMNKRFDLKHYFPCRNLLFASYLATYADYYSTLNNLDEVYIGLGIHRHECYNQYWDITKDFAENLQNLLSLNYSTKIKVYTPFVNWTKKDIVQMALKLKVPYKKTFTCYEPIIEETNSKYIIIPCKKCQACIERQHLSGIEDINDYILEVPKRTKKVVINKKIGGYGLSNEVIIWLYEQGDEHIAVFKYDEKWKDFEDGIIIENNGIKYILFDEHNKETRDCPLLVKCVELFKEKSNNQFSHLKVVEIPEDIEYIVEEGDTGIEWIAENHRIWR
jgi:7-cyano-7-deazaguanine synthase